MHCDEFLREELSKRFKTVQRARGCFLYTKKGLRLTDLYQEGGRAILGWGGSSCFTLMKNVLSRGLTGSFPTEQDDRLTKAVSELLGEERKVFIFRSKNDAVKAGLTLSANGTSFWKPWQDFKGECSPCTIIEPPLPWTQDIFILAVSPSILYEASFVPEGVFLNAPMKVSLTRSIYNLIAEIKIRKESEWFLYDKYLKKYFERKGPYLYPKMKKEAYRDFFLFMLDNNVVISPDYNVPSIVPYKADPGVFTFLTKKEFCFE